MIGRLAMSPAKTVHLSNSNAADIHGDVWQKVRLLERLQESRDTIRLRFASPGQRHVLVPPGQHLLFGAEIGGEWVVRPYTPISPPDADVIELLVKIYAPHGDIPGGKMSMWMHDSLQIGSHIQMKGPCGHIMYCGGGDTVVHDITLRLQRYSFLAGGTGITPVYAMIRALLDDEAIADDVHISLLYSNKTVADVLLRVELDALVLHYPHRFELWHTITTPLPEDMAQRDVKFLEGRINRHMIEETLYPPSLQSATFVCGPPPMVESVLASLEHFGVTADGLLEF